MTDKYDYKSNDQEAHIVLVDAHFTCTGCKQLKPASEVGLRKMQDGIIRNQPQCHNCRKTS